MNSKKKPVGELWNIIQSKCVYIVLGIISFMILSLCFQNTINYDEFFSLNWCRLDWKPLMEQLMVDVHPPLYYMVLKMVLDLTNDSIFFARLLSAAFCIAFLWVGSLFAQKNFGTMSALFFACFTYLNPFMIQKSTEVRMYMMGSAFAIFSGIMAYRIMKRAERKDWILFTLSSLTVAYIQYYGLLTMCFLYAGILIYFIAVRDKKNLLAWVKCSLATIVGYLPWLPTALRQVTSVNGEYWIEMSDSRLAPIRDLFYSDVPYTEHIFLLIMIAFVLTALFVLIKEKSVEAYWMLVCNSGVWGILVFSILYAMYVRPILVSRYLLIPICLAFLGMAGIVRYMNKYIIIVICLLCTLVGILRYESAITVETEKNTAKTIEFIEQNIDDADSIVYTTDIYGHLENCMILYFPELITFLLETDNGEYIHQVIEDEDQNVWFFDMDSSLKKREGLNLEGYELEEFGEYGFGGTIFKVYKVIK